MPLRVLPINVASVIAICLACGAADRGAAAAGNGVDGTTGRMSATARHSVVIRGAGDMAMVNESTTGGMQPYPCQALQVAEDVLTYRCISFDGIFEARLADGSGTGTLTFFSGPFNQLVSKLACGPSANKTVFCAQVGLSTAPDSPAPNQHGTNTVSVRSAGDAADVNESPAGGSSVYSCRSVEVAETAFAYRCISFEGIFEAHLSGGAGQGTLTFFSGPVSQLVNQMSCQAHADGAVACMQVGG